MQALVRSPRPYRAQAKAPEKPWSIVRAVPQTHGNARSRDGTPAGGWAAREIGGDPELLGFLPGKETHREIWEIAEQLLGAGTLIEPSGRRWRSGTSSGGGRSTGFRARGVYNTLPGREESSRQPKKNGCHNEGHPFQLGAQRCVRPPIARRCVTPAARGYA